MSWLKVLATVVAVVVLALPTMVILTTSTEIEPLSKQWFGLTLEGGLMTLCLTYVLGRVQGRLRRRSNFHKSQSRKARMRS